MTITRVEAYSDGVFAVATTLLILNIQIPHVDAQQSAAALIAALLNQWSMYLAYVLAFLTLGAVWISHHQMLRYVARVDTRLQILNLIMLMCITLTPFTTSLLATYLQQPDKLGVVAVVYNGVWIVSGAAFALLWQHIRAARLIKPTIPLDVIRRSTVGFTFGTLIGVVSFVLAFVSPPLSVLSSVALAVFYVAINFLPTVARPAQRP